jgi:AcrR family transcriptional regulator
MPSPRRRSKHAAKAGPAATTGTPALSTRERLLIEARKLLEEGGYAAASVQAIADRCGLAAGALYRHFPSKANLFVEVFREAAQRDIGAMKAAASTGRSVERLEAIIGTHARRALRRPRLAWALIYEPVDPIVDAERLAFRREYRRRMARLLRQGIAAGEIPDQNMELSAAAIVGAIAESLVGPLSPVAGQIGRSEEDLIATLVRFCRRGLGVPDHAALHKVADRSDRRQ